MIRTNMVQDSVRVRFGPYGVPHIYAQNETDAFFSLGYIHAQERLFQMEVIRRVGSGRLAEIFGKELIPIDHFFKALGIEGHSIEMQLKFDRSPDSDMKRCVIAYIDGINKYLDKKVSPPEFRMLGIDCEPFSVKDIYLIAGYMSFSFTEAIRTDPTRSFILEKLGPEYLASLKVDTASLSNSHSVADTLYTQTNIASLVSELCNKIPTGSWTGSNAIVIGPENSISGKVLFENDTHIGFQQPSIWYEAHITTPSYEIYGNYLAGIPFPLIGHNRSMTWGLTLFENDDMNFYAEKPSGYDRYYYKGKKNKFEKSIVNIHVKGSSDTVVTIRKSVHGPIVSDILVNMNDSTGEHPVSLWWSYIHLDGKVLDVTYKLSKSHTINDARDAARIVTAPGINIVYGDTAGNIACWSAGRIPKFKDSVNTGFILDGASGENDVLGYYSFDHNPKIENPVSGYIISANQAPDTNHMAINGYYAPNDRYDRLRSMVNERSGISAGDLKSLALDNISTVQKINCDTLVEILMRSSDLSERELSVLKYMNQWDGKHDLNDVAPVIYYKTLSLIFKNAMEDELGEKRYAEFVNTHLMKASYMILFSDAYSPWWDKINTKEIEDRQSIITESFKMAVSKLSHEFGDNVKNWTWGGYHTLEHEHPIGKKYPFNHFFNVGPFAAPGGIETANNAAFNMTTSGPFKVTYGPAMRIIIDMNDPALGWSINPTGQSGHLLSRHYEDQAEMFISGKFRYMSMDSENINETSNNTLTFYPLR